MKIASINDLHLNKTVYRVMDREFPQIPFRNADFMRAFKWMVDKCINDIKPDLVVIGGDAYDSYEVNNFSRGFLSGQLCNLRKNKIPVVLLTGNHDVCSKNHALMDLQELNLKNIKIVSSPCIMDFKDHRLMFFPYSLDIEQKKITTKEAFHNFNKEIQEKKDDKPSVFFGHFGVKNAILNEYAIDNKSGEIEEGEEITGDVMEITNETTTRKPYYNRREDDIDTEELDALGVDYIILGDFHRVQRLKTKTYGFYTGSIERTDMTELDQKKGFIVYDSEAVENKDWGKCRFIEYPNCRPMIEIKGNLPEIKRKFDNLNFSQHKEAIVKLKFIGHNVELLDFSSGIEEFKKYMTEKINPIHIFIAMPPRNLELREKAGAIEKEIMESGNLGGKEVLNIIGDLIDERIADKTEQEESKNLIREIYEEVVGEQGEN